jgi:hypothetical protein
MKFPVSSRGIGRQKGVLMEISELSEIDMAQVSGGTHSDDYSYDDQGFRHNADGSIDEDDPFDPG